MCFFYKEEFVTSVTEPIITNMLLNIYGLDIDGETNLCNANVLYFDYPNIDFLKGIFLAFLENLNSDYIFLTRGTNIIENTSYLKFKRKSFIKFVTKEKDYISSLGYRENIETYYLIGLTIFDETLDWIIHKNADIGIISFSYQSVDIKGIELLINSKWRYIEE